MESKIEEIKHNLYLAERVGHLLGELHERNDQRISELEAVMAAAMTSALGGRDDKLIAANRAVLEYVERKHNDLYMLLQTSMPVS